MPALSPAGQTRGKFFIFSALCCLVYFTSYLTRINYGAAISEIVDSLQITNQLAGMAVIGSFIAYGVGQPICGMLGDKVGPRAMIFAALLATSVCNIAMSFMSDIYVMTAIWCLNGLFQAMMWPPLVRIMAQSLTEEGYRKTSVGVVTAASIGTIAVYLLVPLCIWLSSWRYSFILPAAVGLAVAFIWFYGIRRFTGAGEQEDTNMIENDPQPAAEPPATMKTGALIAASGLLPIMAAIVLQGALRDGITTWMPSYVNDTYNLGTSISILTGVVLPIFTVLSISIATSIHRAAGNELKAASYLWGAGFVAAAALTAVFASSAWASILLMAVLSGCMHGVNMMLISHLPRHFVKYGKVSTMSGLLNAFTYVGSAISIYGIAALSDAYGWQFTISTWGVIAFAGLIICALCIRPWGRFLRGGAQQNMTM